VLTHAASVFNHAVLFNAFLQIVNDACDAQLSSALLLALDDGIVSSFIRCFELITAADVAAFVGVVAHCLNGQQLLGSAHQLASKLSASEFVFLLFRAIAAAGIDVTDPQWAVGGFTDVLDVLLRSNGALVDIDSPERHDYDAVCARTLRVLSVVTPSSLAVASDRMAWLCCHGISGDDTTVTKPRSVLRFACVH
jgi:hypothetical protein